MGRRTQLSTSLDPKTGKPVVSSAGKFMGMNTIYGRDGDHGQPYMTRAWFWRLRLHIFHRGDQDPDHHDHPWNFLTFPLTSYVEEVVVGEPMPGTTDEPDPATLRKRMQLVRAWWPHYRPATHCHRVLGAWNGEYARTMKHQISDIAMYLNAEDVVDYSKKIVTIVWFSKPKRAWGFLKNRDGKWCWVAWREYVLGGGKDAPCE